MVKANFDFLKNNSFVDMEIRGSTNEIILELSLILIRIKASCDKEMYQDILKSMEIINNSIEDGIDADDLQDMFVKTYLKLSKKVGE